jgi:hypothetical protein
VAKAYTSGDLRELHEEALERFQVTADAETKQRQRELIDLKFADPICREDQWDAGVLASRDGLDSGHKGLPAVPARPSLVINKLRQPIQQVQNQQRQTRLSVQFAPDGPHASKDDAAAFADIVRAIQADSRAHLARQWAFDRAIKCGRGFYRIETDYVNDRSFDQKIVYKRILNQFSVYFYPFCQEPDFSDAKWCFLTDDLPLPEYRRRFPDSQLASADSEMLTAYGDEHPGWIGGSEEGRTVRVAEYYWFEETYQTLVAVRTPTGDLAVLESDLPTYPGAQVLPGLQRTVTTKVLCWATLNAQEFVKEADQADLICERDGRFIPVVPVIADESNIQGERRYTGIVRPALDAQRLFNVEASSLAEAVHLGPLSPFIGYAEQFEGYEAWWAQLNLRRFPYLPVNSRDGSGNPLQLPLPQRNTAEQPIQAITVSLEKAADYIHDTTGVPPVALGNLDPHERSGKAILASQKQSELGTSGYIDNLANCSMLLEGKILKDLVPAVYDRRGRVVSCQGDEDARKTVMLGQPYRLTDSGVPQPTHPADPQAKTIDLHRGEYEVAVTIGKSFTTKREEGAESMSQLAQAAPQMVPLFADLWVGNMDFPGAQQIAARLAKMVPPQVQDEQQTGAMQAQQLQQQVAMLTQQLQQLAPLADKNKAGLMEAQMKAQADVQQKQIDADTRIKVALIQATSTEINTQAKIDAENARTFVEAEENKLSRLLDLHMQRLDQVHARMTQALDHAHERVQAHQDAVLGIAQQQADQQHDAGMASLDHQAATAQADQQGQIASDAAQQQAALQPQPTGDSNV